MGSSRPRIVVFGAGAYYQKLRSGLKRHFELARVVDVAAPEVLGLAAEDEAIFIQAVAIDDVAGFSEGMDAALVLTPPGEHVRLACELIKARVPVLVEKPICTSHQDLDRLATLVTESTPAYFSDFYLDVRASPLLWSLGQFQPRDWRRGILANAEGVSRVDIGEVRHIDSALLETYSIHDSTWLRDREQGGVVLDMMIHQLAILRHLFPEQELQIRKVELGFHAEGADPGVYSSEPSTAGESEACAFVDGILRPGSINLRFKVAKNSRQQERYFLVKGTKGFVEQYFEPDHPLAYEVDGRPGQVTQAGDRYELAVRAFWEWMNGPRLLHGWDSGSWAARTALNIRDLGRKKPSPTRSRSPQRVSPPDPSVEGKAPDYHKRRFILALVRFGVGTVFGLGSVLSKYFWGLAEKRRDEYDLAEPRQLALARLFSLPRELKLAPGTEHRYGHRTRRKAGDAYPHDAFALEPFARYLQGDYLLVDGETFPTESYSPDTLLIQTGSPTSSSLVRGLMESPASRLEQEIRASLQYTIQEDKNARPVKVISGMEGGTWVEKRAKTLVDLPTGEVLYHDEENVRANRELARDILLLSRLPAPSLGCDVLFVSGAHGAGTQAVELLFRSGAFTDLDLGELLGALGGSRYWQVVLEVGGLEHKKPMTVANSISVSSIARPQRLEIPSWGSMS